MGIKSSERLKGGVDKRQLQTLALFLYWTKTIGRASEKLCRWFPISHPALRHRTNRNLPVLTGRKTWKKCVFEFS